MTTKKAIKWVNALDSVLIAKTKGSETGKSKIAAFDLDGTLISTKSGNTYAKNEHDWKWWDPSVPQKIKSLHNEGFKIVVFSNQNGLNSDKKINSFKFKIETILNEVDTPVLFMAALKKNIYRKPMTGMWDWFAENNEAHIDKGASFYVGDAAGRQAEWKPKYKKDHSCGDRKFAQNIQIEFYTPEEFFLKEPKAKFSWGGFNPKEYLSSNLPLYTPDTPLTVEDHNELIVCVGYPASGKSSFVKKFIVPKGYVYVNQDTLKTRDRCVKACKEALANKQSVVIDNTNPEASTRSLYIKLAKDANVPVRCFYFGDNEDLAQHNNYYRALYKSQEKKDVLSIIAYRTFKSKLQEPSTKEGFSEVKRINFKFDTSSEKDTEAWCRWWV
ncbi:polynucleotide kinase 3 phosphatase-domain-containing protein [Mucor mucedo]|uniref:polynucleotide kinase 3 phosphatase-domain-containing protein n=1 Tax=Mucor mucedo TaxID=29922 RepID=UPI00222114C9|nr:polynucleotide kinase 3 phosphatase-domain-containing protein [Mucor mucedo]KAI7889401.1 polynucleotide kinase 3 phosphatase-domain-containing protein [Mucor mucedo]